MDKPCPCCGYCPTCGRRAADAPSYPYPYYGPIWVAPVPPNTAPWPYWQWWSGSSFSGNAETVSFVQTVLTDTAQ